MALKQGQYGLAKEQARDRGLTNDPQQTGTISHFWIRVKSWILYPDGGKKPYDCPHPKPTASLKTCTYTFYSRITRTAKQPQQLITP